jgi:hypothetical protein
MAYQKTRLAAYAAGDIGVSDDEIAGITFREITQARGYDSDTLSSVRTQALDLYYGRLPGAAPEGRVQTVSLDVADALHATLAQISPVVRTSQIEFEAQSQDDEQAAQTETDFVRVAIERASGYDTMDKSCFDALLIGNGWLHVYVDENKRVTEQIFPPNLPDEAVYAITMMAPPDTKITLRAGKDKTVAKVTKTIRTLKIESVPPESMMYSECGADFDIDQVRFVARERLYTAAQLKAKGISDDKIEKLRDATTDYQEGSRARQGNLQNDGDYLSVEDANRLKRVYCCYIRLQRGVNETELRHVWMGEDQDSLLLNEPAEYVPYITGSAVPMPHRITGTGFGELLKNIQEAKTHTLRQYLDNLAVMNASRLGVVEGQVNMKDLENGRINGVVRMRSPDAVIQLPAADIGAQAVNALGYLDQVRTQRVGAALDFSEVQAQLMGTSATAAAGQLSKVEMMGGWFAGNIVRTMLLPLFMMTHRILRTELGGVQMARVGGKWAQTDTSQWQERMVTDIHLGLTTTEKAERLMALTQTIQMMQGMMAQGGTGIITDLPRMYNAMGDWIRTASLGAPDQYLIDPASQEAQQAQQMQADGQKKMAEEQLRIELEAKRFDFDYELEKQRRDLAFKKWDAELSAEIEEAKLTVDGTIKAKELKLKEKEGEDKDEDMDTD